MPYSYTVLCSYISVKLEEKKKTETNREGCTIQKQSRASDSLFPTQVILFP